MSFSIQNLSVQVAEKAIVHGVSLIVAPGEVHVLMGPNGSGKSTLVRALFGHPQYLVTGGTVEVDGVDVTELPVYERAKKGLYLSMQHPPEIEGVTISTFLEKAYSALHGEEINPLEYYTKLVDTCTELGIDQSFLERPLNKGFSGGEKKLCEALQLVALEPKYAVLDEIDSGVDVDALKKVFKAVTIRKENGTGFLIISHHPSLLEHIVPNKVHVLRDGAIVQSGGKEVAEEIARSGFMKA